MEDIDVPVLTEEQAVTFDSLIDGFPYNPVTENGRGFLAPISRAIGHVLYLAGRYDDKNGPTPEKAKDELLGALTHWGVMNTEIGFSDKAKGEINLIGDMLTVASTNIGDWSKDEGIKNTQKLVNRMLQLMANLDREVLGIPNSDAGYSL